LARTSLFRQASWVSLVYVEVRVAESKLLAGVDPAKVLEEGMEVLAHLRLGELLQLQVVQVREEVVAEVCSQPPHEVVGFGVFHAPLVKGFCCHRVAHVQIQTTNRFERI
jgi:hypothetical protein